MSQTCSKCNKVVRAFQRLLVYEPLTEPCKKCERPRPYPSAPAFGTTIKVCSYGEMERMCFPKLCDCPCREMPLCPDARRRERICMAIYWLATFALFAYLFDSGIFRHPVHTTRLTERVQEIIGGLYAKEEGAEEEEVREKKGKDAKGKGGKTEDTRDGKVQNEGRSKDPKREFDKLSKTYNMANLWNAAVIVTGDFLITLIKLPNFLLAKALEVFYEPGEEGAEKNEKTKKLKHDNKGEVKKADLKNEEKKQEARKEEPKKKQEPKKKEDKKQEAKKAEAKKKDEKKPESKEEEGTKEDEQQEAKA